MSATVSNASELYLAPGGPTFRLAKRIGIRGRTHGAPWARIIALVLVTWVPMCIFAILQRRALEAMPRDSFLLDFATHARFFVGLPVLVLAEEVVGSRLKRAGLEFARQGFVRIEDVPVFERAIARLARRRESIPAAAVIIALALIGPSRFTFESASGPGAIGWRSIVIADGHGFPYSLAAIWNNVVAVPVFLFLLYRWLWRLLIWAWFLFDVSRMNLQLVPTHADRAGGLGFLGIAHAPLASLAFAGGCVLSAEAAFRIVYEGATLDTFRTPMIILLVITQLLVLGPLLVFCPALARARRAALISYGSLVVQYNRSFHEKWVDAPGPENEKLMGSPDIQSLADLGNSFRFVGEMGIAPFGRRAILQLAVAAAAPGLPLLLLVVPLREIVDALAKIAL